MCRASLRSNRWARTSQRLRRTFEFKLIHNNFPVSHFAPLTVYYSERMGFISKTAAFMGMPALRNLVSDSIAIDMGSATTVISVRGRGLLVDQPSR